MTIIADSRFPLLLTVCALVLHSLTGCVADGPPPRFENHSMPVQPAGAVPAHLVFSVAQSADSDSNGYFDSFQTVSFVFADSHPISLVTPGTFEFRLVTRKGELLRRWTYDATQAGAHLTQPPPGPAYAISPSLLDGGGTDKLDGSLAELECTFTPDAGGRITSGHGRTVQVGRVR